MSWISSPPSPEAYEEKHYPIGDPDSIAAIQHRMEALGLTRKDLEPLLGSRARVSEILGRKRKLSIDMIRKLHARLGIPASVLIGGLCGEGQMKLIKPRLFLSILMFSLSFVCFNARADIAYNFVKVDCRPDLKSVVITPFFDWNDSGENRSKHLEKNTYYLTDLTSNKTKINCNLGERRNVEITGGESAEHPRDNSVDVSVGGRDIPRLWTNIVRDEVVTITALPEENFVNVHRCADEQTCPSASSPFQCNLAKKSNSEVCYDKKFTAPSFDCRLLKPGIEGIICNTDALSEADSNLGKAFDIALRRSLNKISLIKEQRKWMLERKTLCENSTDVAVELSCLQKLYEQRTDQLLKIQ